MKSILKTVFASILFIALLSCQRPARLREAQGAVWNTTYHIIYSAPADLRDSILTVFRQVEQSLSPFAKTSLISRVNRGEEGVVADSLLVRIFTESQRICRLSGGAFDPTVAPLINLWGFGYKPGETEPSQAHIDSLLASVGIIECSIALEGAITRKSPSTEFNFSAITKGYGVDLIGEMLERNGADSYMVEIGGEIAVRGLSPRRQPWRVQIDAPVVSDSSVIHESLAIVEVTDCGIATSGNYRNYRETADGRVWHTISPTTGRPAATDVTSATVIAPDCMTADALATSCMAMPSADAIRMIEAIPGVSALIVTRDSTLITAGPFPLKSRRE